MDLANTLRATFELTGCEVELYVDYPSMDMISCGPNIKGVHSPDERVQIS